MNQQNKQMNAASSSEPPVKRKRGRPRKDENAPKKANSPLPLNSPPPPPPPPHGIEQVHVPSYISIDTSMIGKTVTAVINGTFDAGYFLSVKIGNNSIPLHGLAFQPGCYVPVSATNDIAPQVKMYRRIELPVPPPLNATFPTVTPSKTDPSPHMGETNPLQKVTPYGLTNKQPTAQLKNIDMIEKYEVGQSYEATKDVVSESASESMVDMLLGNGTIDEVPQGQNRDIDCGGLESNAFHKLPLVNTNNTVQSEFKLTDHPVQVQVPVQTELNQTPMVSSESVHIEPKSLNLDLHQTPPADEPQSFPPKPVTEPMDIETENPKSTQIGEESESGKPVRNAAAAENAVYEEGGSKSTKGEFGGGESVFPEAENSGFAGQASDVDFSIADVVPAAQPESYKSYVADENENR